MTWAQPRGGGYIKTPFDTALSHNLPFLKTMSAPAKATTSQPEATQMNVMNVAKPAAKEGATCKHGEQCEHEHKASRMRGGGAGKDCFMGTLDAF
ncbi:hypothetical protein B0H12DRAFT_684793 [Mycena haematopus]|nr:hypothetical protein B0H12DRAFT_684793 [Mycena haematopus]